MYRTDFQLAMLERKVSKVSGESNDDETRALNGQIDQLTERLEAAAAQRATLAAAVKRAETDLGVWVLIGFLWEEGERGWGGAWRPFRMLWNRNAGCKHSASHVCVP
jgi:hypothetical protein